ncbi:MAG: hypothetical protein LBQ54_09315 [Planctomycetaceae bacterium]|jgi:hypothetical protein|nr:hypothetical protein [Planctomycetaceae bacterium]
MYKNDRISNICSYQNIVQKIKLLALPFQQEKFFTDDGAYDLTSITKQYYQFTLIGESSKKIISIEKIYFDNADQIVPLLKKLQVLDHNVITILIDNIESKQFLFYATNAYGNRGHQPPKKIFLGEACQEILFSLVYPVPVVYKFRKDSQGNLYKYPHFFWDNYIKQDHFNKKYLQEWWRENKHLTLKQIQLNMIDWRIHEEEKIGFYNEEGRLFNMTPLLKRKQEIQRSANDGFVDIFPLILRYYKYDIDDIRGCDDY